MQAMVFVGVCTLFIMLYAEVLSIKPFVEWTHQMLLDWCQIGVKLDLYQGDLVGNSRIGNV